MEKSVDVDPLEKDDNVIGYGEMPKETRKHEGKELSQKNELETEDQTRNTKTEIKKEYRLGEIKRELPDSLHKDFIGFGEDDKKEIKQEYDFRTSNVTEMKEECTLGKIKRKMSDEDVKLEVKEEYIEKEIEELPDSLPKIKIEMNEEYLDLPKRAKIEIEEEFSKLTSHSQQQIDENTLETEKKWDLFPVGSLFIVKCPECQYEEYIKNTYDMNLFSIHMKTHNVFRYPRTAQGYTCSHPCSICSINLKVGELMDHMGIHGYSGIYSGFWKFQQNKWGNKNNWCVLCPVCPSTRKAKFGTTVKMCNFPKHVKKVHGPFVYEKMNSEEGALGCQMCGESKVILTNIEMHMKCMESRNDKDTQLNDVNMGKQKEASNKDKESGSDHRFTVSKSAPLNQSRANYPSNQTSKATIPAGGNEPSWHLGNKRCSSGDEDSKYSECDEETKMVLVVRQDLNMGKGKATDQCCNATLAAYKSARQKCPKILRSWEANGQPKVIVKVDNEEDLVTLLAQARSLGLVSAVVADGELKQMAPPTKTVVAVGPGPVDLVDQVTGALELL